MNNPAFLPHLHAFRGLAILAIVSAHAWSFPIFWTGQLDSPELTALFQIMETLFHGSTIYFAIISGMLFSLVLSSKSWSRFYLSKLRYILLPYCILTLLISALNWQFSPVQSSGNSALLLQFLEVFAHNIVTGQAMIHFWYIPVLGILFIATPLLSKLMKKQIWLALGIALIPLFISRSPFPDFLKPQSFVYFAGAYMLGMIIGEYHTKVQNWVTQYWRSILVVSLTTTLLIFCLFRWDYQPHGFFSIIQSLVYLQKSTLCLLVLHWLANRESTLPKWLMVLGSYSFSVYFLHVLIMWPFIVTFSDILIEHRTALTIFPIGLLNLICAVSASIAIAWCVKRISGKRSRMLIGA